MIRKVRILCEECRRVNTIQLNELALRVNKNSKATAPGTLCCQCCKKINWGSEQCKTCSEYTFCDSTLLKNSIEWLGTIKGL